jgi:hypothetical protein
MKVICLWQVTFLVLVYTLRVILNLFQYPTGWVNRHSVHLANEMPK